MNTYYVAGIPFDGNNALSHHGIKGQKWGIRRFQNPDGTLTEEGRRRYGSDVEKIGSRKLEKQLIRSMWNNRNKTNLEKLEKRSKKDARDFKKLNNYENVINGKRGKFADEMVRKYAKALLKDVGYEPNDKAIEYLASQSWFTSPYDWASTSYNSGSKNYRSQFSKLVVFN